MSFKTYDYGFVVKMQILLLVDWYYQVEIRYLKSFSDVVCLKLLGSEFHTLGQVYLVDCFP